MIGFASSPRFVDHLTGWQHPERPDRIRAIAKAVRDAGLLDSPNPFPNFALNFGAFPENPTKLHELPEPARQMRNGSCWSIRTSMSSTFDTFARSVEACSIRATRPSGANSFDRACAVGALLESATR